MGKVSVIIPQHGRSDLTIMAVQSLQKYHESGAYEVVIVDDGSPPQHLRDIQLTIRGEVRIESIPGRRGITAAWSRGIQSSTGSTVIFLNNDTVTRGEWLPQLVAPLATEEFAISGPEIRMERDLPVAVRGEFSPALFLSGWCFALRRSTLEQVGGFDEQLRLYFSDTDLQCRLWRTKSQTQQRRDGLDIADIVGPPFHHVEELPIEHLGHQSTRSLLSRKTQWRNDRRRFQRKWSR